MAKKINNEDVVREKDLLFKSCFGKSEERIITQDELLTEMQSFIGQPISATLNWTIHYRIFYKCCCASIERDELTFYNPESNHDVFGELDLKISLKHISEIKVTYDGYDRTIWFYENGKCIFYISFDRERFC